MQSFDTLLLGIFLFVLLPLNLINISINLTIPYLCFEFFSLEIAISE